MTRRVIPHKPRADFAATVLAVGEIVFDETSSRLFCGDGVTPGGVASAYGFTAEGATGAQDIADIIKDNHEVNSADLRAYLEPVSRVIDVANPITLTSGGAMDLTMLGKTVLLADAAANYAILLPPVGGANIGDCIYVRVKPDCTKVVTLSAPSGTIDGAGGRPMWRGETALLQWDGADWHKLDGISLPFCGYLTANAAKVIAAAATWTQIPLQVAGGDRTLLNLCFDGANNRFKAPRAGQWRFDARFSITPNADATQCYVNAGSSLGAAPQLGSAPVVDNNKKFTFSASVLDALNAADFYQLNGYFDGGSGATHLVANYTAYLDVPTLGFSEVPTW